MNAIPFFSLTSPQAQTLEPDADSESEDEKARITAEASVAEDDKVRASSSYLSLDSG